VSIPLEQYPFFAQGVCSLVLGLWKKDIKRQGLVEGLTEDEIDEKCEKLEEFYNVSFTPIECSVICATELVGMLFGKALAIGRGAEQIREEYVAIKVDSDGQDTGERVLEVSAPMTTASISIFFITTYFSDYVLVPVGARDKVVRALDARGFVFSDVANSYVSLPSSEAHSNTGKQQKINSSEATSCRLKEQGSGGATPSYNTTRLTARPGEPAAVRNV
jgi:hypothetical protein